MVFQYSPFRTLIKIRKEKKVHLHSLLQVSENVFFRSALWSNTFFTWRGLCPALLITAHRFNCLVPSSFILTRSSLVPDSIDLCRSLLKRGFLWGFKCRSPHYKTKHLTTKPIYSKQTTDYKLQWSSITSPLSHAMLGQTPLTHYCELWQCLGPKCSECSRNNYLYACSTPIGYQLLKMSQCRPCSAPEATVKLKWARGECSEEGENQTIQPGLLWKVDSISDVWMPI